MSVRGLMRIDFVFLQYFKEWPLLKLFAFSLFKNIVKDVPTPSNFINVGLCEGKSFLYYFFGAFRPL